jgi:hypothetical protein
VPSWAGAEESPRTPGLAAEDCGRAEPPTGGAAHVLLAQALITASNHIDHVMTAHRRGVEAGGEDRPDQEGSACRCWRQRSSQPAGHPFRW